MSHPSVEGESEIPWKPPVAAAILGALLVAAYVIFAVVTGPEVEGEAADDPVARVVSVVTAPTGTFVAVSSAGGPVEVAYWELATGSGSVRMDAQYRDPGSGVGPLTVAFPPGTTVDGADLVAHPVVSSRTATHTIELDRDLPYTVYDLPVEVGDATVVVESLTIDEDGGYVTWSVDGDLPARLDVVVTVADAVTLLPGYLPAYPDTDGGPVARPYGFGAGYRLVALVAPDGAAGDPATVTVELRAEVVTAVSDTVVPGLE